MPSRLRLYDLRVSRFPRLLGLCQDNVPEIAAYANAITQTLLYDKAAGDESWVGTWAEVQFSLTRENPFVTLPREIARLEMATVCDYPIEVSNQFVNYLLFGNGRLRKNRRCNTNFVQAVYRNNAVLFTDMTDPPNYIRIYITDERDIAKRVLIQGTDSNGNTVFSTDNLLEVTGIFVALDQPFVTSPLTFQTITGLQKDQTYGRIEVFQVNPTTGDEILLLTMQPSETTANYRRMYFNNLPCGCCPDPGDTNAPVQINAIAKLEPIPVQVDTDYLLLQSLQAYTEEAMALRLQEADTPASQGLAQVHHMRAIRLLIGESSHYNGINSPSLGYAPFGSARLEKVRISMV